MEGINRIGTIHIIFSEDSLQNAKRIIEDYTEIRTQDIPTNSETYSFKEIVEIDKNLFEEKTLSVSYNDGLA